MKGGSSDAEPPADKVTEAEMMLLPVGKVAVAVAVELDSVPLNAVLVALIGLPVSGLMLRLIVVPKGIPDAANSIVVGPVWFGRDTSSPPPAPDGTLGTPTPPTDTMLKLGGLKRRT